MIRHGEKPANGLGQITCKGLNRALALPDLLMGRYGKPDAVYAPNPSDQVKDHGLMYSYVRPLATIEPTAIRAGLPVHTQIGYKQIDKLQNELTKPMYANSRIFVAWEHGYLRGFAQQFLHSFGEDSAAVPAWTPEDYGTIYVFQLTRHNSTAHLAFRVDQEALDASLSDACPSGGVH
ncbi:MAG TPA: histidine phosphatase family protein [Silvibacterium sp.]|nr:histidine phosphatase family protein [Silvibacterium sp.]